MANWYVDDSLATGLNDGTDPDNAWQSMKTALEYATFANGDFIWYRRTCSYPGTTIVQMVDQGGFEVNGLLHHIAWPRNTTTGTITFTQGSNVLSASSVTPDIEKHLARKIHKTVDTDKYFLTAIAHKIDYITETGTFTEGLMVTDSISGATGQIHRLVDNGTTGTLWIVVKSGTFAATNAITDTSTGAAIISGTPADDGFIIDRKYPGSTETAKAFTIQQDYYYDTAQAIDDSSYTIKLGATGWSGDADDLPILDFSGGTNYLYTISIDNIYMQGFHLKGGSGTYGGWWFRSCERWFISNWIMETVENAEIVNCYTSPWAHFREVIGFGDGNVADSVQRGLETFRGVLEDCAFYNFGDVGITTTFNPCKYYNVNLGVELPDMDTANLALRYVYEARDLQLGTGDSIQGDYSYASASENHNKILNNSQMNDGAKRYFQRSVVEGSGDPYKRSGGSNYVIECDLFSGDGDLEPPGEMSSLIFPHVFSHSYDVDTESRNYRYYIQNSDATTILSRGLYLEAEYIDSYDATSGAYHYTRVKSDEDITGRSDASDWTQYIEVTGIAPAVASTVTIKCYFVWYDVGFASAFIDPQAVIT